jgi:hypothetical protein
VLPLKSVRKPPPPSPLKPPGTPPPPPPVTHTYTHTHALRSPDEDKFRTIRLGNAAFHSKVASLAGSLELLEMCGFTVGRRGLAGGGGGGGAGAGRAAACASPAALPSRPRGARCLCR